MLRTLPVPTVNVVPVVEFKVMSPLIVKESFDPVELNENVPKFCAAPVRLMIPTLLFVVLLTVRFEVVEPVNVPPVVLTTPFNTRFTFAGNENAPLVRFNDPGLPDVPMVKV